MEIHTQLVQNDPKRKKLRLNLKQGTGECGSLAVAREVLDRHLSAAKGVLEGFIEHT